MKINKTILIAVGIGVVVIAGISLGMALNQQTAEKLRVENELNLAKKRLSLLDNDKLLAQKDQLNVQIDEYNSRTADVKSKLVYSLDNINITDSLIKDAKDCGVDILEIVSPGLGSENLGGISYESMNMTVKAQGLSDSVARFVYSLKQVFPTCVVKSVTMEILNQQDLLFNQPSFSAGDNATNPAGSIPAADAGPLKDTLVSLNFVIYNYKGN